MESMTWPASLDVLGSIRQYVRQAAEEAGLEKKRIGRLQLAVDEIATNIILYGYQRAGRSGNIEAEAVITSTP